MLGYSQNHLAVAGGCVAFLSEQVCDAPTRYREVVLTVSKHGILASSFSYANQLQSKRRGAERGGVSDGAIA